MLYTKNRLFAKYGHECCISYTCDDLPMFIPSKSLHKRIFRKLVRMRMASEINKRGNYYLKSQGAIACEHYKHLKYLYMIHPFSDIRTIWEIVMILVYIHAFFSIPVDLLRYQLSEMVAFHTDVTWRVHRTLGDFLCIFDCCLNFITGYYDTKRKVVIMEPRLVIKNYLKTYFIFDIISSLPGHIVFSLASDENIIVIITHHLSIFKIVRYITFRKFILNLAETFELSYVISRCAMIVCATVLYIHLVTCIFLYMFGALYSTDEKVIYVFKGQEKVEISKGYFETLYMTLMIIVNASFTCSFTLNIVKIFVITIWIGSKIICIYLICRLMEIVMAQNSSTHKYVELQRQLKEYMRHKQLPDHIQKRLLYYYEFRFQKNYFRESEMLNTISGQLRQEIVMHSCRKLVENVGFFRNLPLTLLVRIVSCLKLEIYLLNDVIVRANTKGDCMYFISSGTVAVYTKSGKEICHLEDGAHFGEIALVMNNNLRSASVLAVEICELYMLERKDFIKVICPYPDLLNNVTYIAADRLERTQILDG